MNRRGFRALASGLLVPVPEPVKTYFFAPAAGWGGGLWDEHLKRVIERLHREGLIDITEARKRLRARLEGNLLIVSFDAPGGQL